MKIRCHCQFVVGLVVVSGGSMLPLLRASFVRPSIEHRRRRRPSCGRTTAHNLLLRRDSADDFRLEASAVGCDHHHHNHASSPTSSSSSSSSSASSSSSSSAATAAAAALLTSSTTPLDLDWSFLDGAYLITCPKADPGGVRLATTKRILSNVGLLNLVQIKEFDTDDEDRIRGCYTSHLSVLRDALADLKSNNNNNNNKHEIKIGSRSAKTRTPVASIKQEEKVKSERMILVLEDNMAYSGWLSQDVLDSIASYASSDDADCDVIQLSYIPYVPNLVVSRTDDQRNRRRRRCHRRIVKLRCGIGSALGTTAYIIKESSMKRLVRHDDDMGYYAAIPDVMAEVFPKTRAAAFPVPFVRAPRTKSLVNPQLDDLRELLFRPAVTLAVQTVLIMTGWSTNVLLPLTVCALLVVTALSGLTTVRVIGTVLATGILEGPMILPALGSFAFTVFSLLVIAQGIALAPKPPQTASTTSTSTPSTIKADAKQ